MKTYLNVPFNKKDEVKTQAAQAGVKIEWDKSRKRWYYSGEAGEELPDFLKKYQPTIEVVRKGDTSDWMVIDKITTTTTDWAITCCNRFKQEGRSAMEFKDFINSTYTRTEGHLEPILFWEEEFLEKKFAEIIGYQKWDVVF